MEERGTDPSMTTAAKFHIGWSVFVVLAAAISLLVVAGTTHRDPGQCDGIGFGCALSGGDAAELVGIVFVLPLTIGALLVGNVIVGVVASFAKRRAPSASELAHAEARRAAHSAMAAVAALDPREESDRERALAWIDSGAPIWRAEAPATPPEHLVVYCALIDIDARAILLVDHRNAQLWLPTGGHVDPGEAPADAARRELGEELGVGAPLLMRFPMFITRTTTVGLDSGHIDVSLWYGFRGTVGMAVNPDTNEFTDHRWWPFADISSDARVDPELPRFVAKLRAYLEVDG